MKDGTIAERLVSISPKSGDAVFIPAGTVHTLGNDVVVFEVQQNSDVTFSLYDWGHIDSVTKELRPLQVDQALACIDFGSRDSGLVAPRVETTMPVERERLFDCAAFLLWRVRGQAHSPLERQQSRACWLASRDQAGLCMMALLHGRKGRCLAFTGRGRSVRV